MDTPDAYAQNATGSMTYPSLGTLNRILFKSPLIWWRAGMGPFLGKYMLVLTTWGRKSCLPRHTMLSYTLLDGRIYLGVGWPERSDWYRNLLTDPHVTLQVANASVSGTRGEVVIPALARRVEDEAEFRLIATRLFETGGDSHFKPWLASYGIDYTLDDMIEKRDRLHQLALDLQPPLRPTQLVRSGYPPPMESDLKWIWPVLIAAFFLGWLTGNYTRRD